MLSITLELPIFMAKRLEKVSKETFFNSLVKNTCNCVHNSAIIASQAKERRDNMSSNRHKADLRQVTFWLPIENYYQLRRFARDTRQTMSEIIEREIQRVVRDVTLTYEDALAVAEEIRRNEERGRPPRG